MKGSVLKSSSFTLHYVQVKKFCVTIIARHADEQKVKHENGLLGLYLMALYAPRACSVVPFASDSLRTRLDTRLDARFGLTSNSPTRLGPIS